LKTISSDGLITKVDSGCCRCSKIVIVETAVASSPDRLLPMVVAARGNTGNPSSPAASNDENEEDEEEVLRQMRLKADAKENVDERDISASWASCPYSPLPTGFACRRDGRLVGVPHP
jgi:hypothetical protein